MKEIQAKLQTDSLTDRQEDNASNDFILSKCKHLILIIILMNISKKVKSNLIDHAKLPSIVPGKF